MTTTEFKALANQAVALGAKPPIWHGTEPAAECWADRAMWLISRAADGRDIASALDETNRYSGYTVRVG